MDDIADQDKPDWEKPELRIVELEEVDSIADLDVAFATFCTADTDDL
jgi:hypothetical protein